MLTLRGPYWQKEEEADKEPHNWTVFVYIFALHFCFCGRLAFVFIYCAHVSWGLYVGDRRGKEERVSEQGREPYI